MSELFDRLVHGLAIVGAGILLVLTLFMTLDVVLRYVFSSSIRGSLELIEFMLVGVFSLCLAWAQRNNHHVSVDLFVDIAPQWLRSCLFYFNSIVTFVLLVVMAYAILRSGNAPGKQLEISSYLGIPVTPFYWLLAGGVLLMSLQILVDMFKGAPRKSVHIEAAI